FPWELLYPMHYALGEGHYDPTLFWGDRFQIESLLFPSDEEVFPKVRQQAGKLSVIMGVNKAIDEDWKGRSFLPAQFHKDYCAAKLKTRHQYRTEYDEIRDILVTPHAESLIYFFCHGTAGKLSFDAAKAPLAPSFVNAKRRYPSWPIVFINACDAGN